ncbi:MAG: amidohydrolase [Planctomycetota bacterium]|nr:MAG: amidohydrolase [Planctomycetota bacterium]
MAGPPIENGVVLIQNGKIKAVGPASSLPIPSGWQQRKAKVVTPGLIDAHATAGLTGIFNQDHDQDQLDHGSAIQAQLRALDAFNLHEPLVAYLRSFGITCLHSSHAPGELVSGQSLVVKTAGRTVDQAVLKAPAMLTATLRSSASKGARKSPGTRAKMVAMLRQEFIRAQDYQRRRKESDQEGKAFQRDLNLEALAEALEGRLPVLITADRAQDIASALRLQQEFGFSLVLDSAAESYLMPEEIHQAGVPVILHPTMARPQGDRENLSFRTAAKLKAAGIAVALQSGYESYVPKVRVVLFEAAVAAAHGLSFEQALATVTVDAARLLGVADRVGSLEAGKDADLALYDGDPFEYTSHCIGVIIDGQVVESEPR